MVADPLSKTVQIDKLKNIVPELSIILAMDLKDGERFFDKDNCEIPYEIDKGYFIPLVLLIKKQKHKLS